MASGRRPLTQELYDSLVIAFREAPGNVSFAARRSLCGRELAKRLWDGKPYRDYPWAKSIKVVLEEEQQAAMARARELARRDAEAKHAIQTRAAEEAIEAQAQERQMLRVARADVLGALTLAASLVPAMQQASRAITEQLKAQADGTPPEIKAKDAMTLLTRHTQLIQRAVGAAEAVIQLSRLDRGASSLNVSIKAEELTLDQALEELEAIEDVLGAARGSSKGSIANVGVRGLGAGFAPGARPRSLTGSALSSPSEHEPT